MDGKAVEEIRDLAREGQFIEHDGQKYVQRGYQVLRQVDRPGSLKVSTLESLAQFVKDNPQGMDLGQAIAIVNDDMTVSVHSGINDIDSGRTLVMKAECPMHPFPFDRFMGSEEFTIRLQTLFLDDESSRELFGYVSKIVIDEGVETSDDGVSQRLTVRKGVSAASATKVLVPSRIRLFPMRIFPECSQPSSEFLIRLRGDKENGASIALFETDGGLWMVEAKRIIAEKLTEDYGIGIPVFA